MLNDFGPWLARYRLKRGIAPLAARYLARPFGPGNSRRMVIYHDANRISFAQIYPFILYQTELNQRYSVEIRCYPFSDLLQGRTRGLDGADIVLLQPWFTISPTDLEKACDQIDRHSPDVELSFIDAYAPNDLRFARVLPERLRFYLKKSLFKDRSIYLRPFRGDTNLTEYYGDLHGIEQPQVNFRVPDSILPKLRLTPSFFTAPHFCGGFPQTAPPVRTGRTLDVQSRLGTIGAPWYQAMRDASLAAIHGIPGISVSPADTLPYRRYMAEMRQARLCFSPFGFGELCWRDIEAFQTGAVLVKPDMGHLETLPDLYAPQETYLAVDWDFGNLDTVVQSALNDDALCARVSREAYRRVSEYLARKTFVSDRAFLFED